MSPESILHKIKMNFVAVLFDLGLYGGGVISKLVELLDLLLVDRLLCDQVARFWIFTDRMLYILCIMVFMFVRLRQFI